MSVFSSWVSYFKDPLVIFGMLLLFGFLIVKYLIKFHVIKNLPEKFESGWPKIAVNYGFLLGLAVVFLGMGLKQKDLNEIEQTNALMLLKAEYENNVSVLKQLSKNTDEVLQAHRKVVFSLRTDGSKILSTIFPKLSQREKAETTVSKQVTFAFEKLTGQRLLHKKTHMAAFNTVKVEIKKTLNNQIQLLNERQDKQAKLYVINDEIWRSYRDVFDEIDGFKVQSYEHVLQQMARLKSQYDKVLRLTEDYFLETDDFMNRSTFLGNGDVYEILSKEHISEIALTEFVIEWHNELNSVEQAAYLFKHE